MEEKSLKKSVPLTMEVSLVTKIKISIITYTPKASSSSLQLNAK